MNALQELLTNTVDYAGLFPPASLSLDQVVANYSQYQASDEKSMLARLILPANKLQAFEKEVQSSPDVTGLPWKISGLVPPIQFNNGTASAEALENALATIQKFNSDHSDIGQVDVVEVKVTNESELNATVESIPESIIPFIEIPLAKLELLDQISAARSTQKVFAKIRTGGIAPELIPSVQSVASFIIRCASLELGFKATAGLHHPIRSEYRLTYEEDSKIATMHGYLNLFVAASIAFHHKTPIDTITAILETSDANQFKITPQAISWRDLTVTGEQIRKFRERGLASFGSCSFLEPVSEIVAIDSINSTDLFPDQN
ncbi:MAG: hypothetical protein AAF623_07095 [Planctomycetota bacterium]